MFKKIVCLVLSFAIFQVQANVPSQQDRELLEYLEKNSHKVEKFIDDLPQEAKEEILALEGLSLEESQPIIADILSHYSEETGANFSDDEFDSKLEENPYFQAGIVLTIILILHS